MAVISSEDTLKMKEAFSQDKKNILAQRASATNGLLKAAEDPFVIARNRNPYSTDLTSDEVTNQKHSGRCWMFAGLNVLRFHLEKIFMRTLLLQLMTALMTARQPCSLKSPRATAAGGSMWSTW